MVTRWLIGVITVLWVSSFGVHAQTLQLPTFVTVGLGYVVVEAGVGSSYRSALRRRATPPLLPSRRVSAL